MTILRGVEDFEEIELKAFLSLEQQWPLNLSGAISALREAISKAGGSPSPSVPPCAVGVVRLSALTLGHSGFMVWELGKMIPVLWPSH